MRNVEAQFHLCINEYRLFTSVFEVPEVLPLQVVAEQAIIIFEKSWSPKSNVWISLVIAAYGPFLRVFINFGEVSCIVHELHVVWTTEVSFVNLYRDAIKIRNVVYVQCNRLKKSIEVNDFLVNDVLRISILECVFCEVNKNDIVRNPFVVLIFMLLLVDLRWWHIPFLVQKIVN